MQKTSLFLLLLLFTYAKGKAQPKVYDPSTDPSAPVMTFKELVYDFGIIKQGENVKHDYVFTNTGKSPLVISNAQSSCGCLVASWPKEPIAPGKSGKIQLYFNSSGKMGPQTKQVVVTSNNRDGNIILTIKGKIEVLPQAEMPFPAGSVSPAKAKPVGPAETGAAEMRFEKTTIDFGTITQDSVITLNYTFFNTGNTELVIRDVKTSCGCMVPYWSREPVAPGKSGIITVKFNPAGKAGIQEKTTTVNYNSADNQPVVLRMKGNIQAKPVTPDATNPPGKSGG